MRLVAAFAIFGHYVLHEATMSDKFEDIRTFIAVVQAKGFAGAGVRMGLAKSAISRRISDLEDRLGTRLLHRTTREVRLTEAGAEFFERGQKLLDELQEVEDLATKSGTQPVGKLVVSAPVSFGINCLAPAIGEFIEQRPRLAVQIDFSDRQVDLVGEGFDMALRIGHMKDSSLVARKLAPIRHAICGSPDYFRRRGKPKTPQDLSQHVGLLYSYVDVRQDWQFTNSKAVAVRSTFSCNNGDVLREMAMAGRGLAYLPTFVVYRAIADGTLDVCLTKYSREAIALYAVYPSTRNLSAKVRVFIDFLVEKFGEEPYWDKEIFAKGK